VGEVRDRYRRRQGNDLPSSLSRRASSLCAAVFDFAAEVVGIVVVRGAEELRAAAEGLESKQSSAAQENELACFEASSSLIPTKQGASAKQS
jgi:hypothetical protein